MRLNFQWIVLFLSLIVLAVADPKDAVAGEDASTNEASSGRKILIKFNY